MKNMNTYLIFEGNCRQAMEFYNKSLGGQLQMMKFSAMPGGCADFPQAKDWIMHAKIEVGGRPILMASDTRPDMPVRKGNNFSISIACDRVGEAERLFKGLGEQGKVDMPLQETFWAERFGMLTDQFGVKWMFNLDKAHAGAEA